MKRLLAYVFIIFSLTLINQKIVAAQLNTIEFKKLQINTQSQQFTKFGSAISGSVEGMRYTNLFFEFSEDNKLKGLIEVFSFDGVTYQGRVNAWFRNLAFNRKKEIACINSNKNIFFEKNDNNSMVSCLNIRIIKKDELSSPDLNREPYIPFNQRNNIIKKFIKKKNLLVSEEMIRAEHYFYKKGIIRWFFFTSEVDINSVKDINEFIANTIKNHQESEDKLGFREKFRIVFKDINSKKTNYLIVKGKKEVKTQIAEKEPIVIPKKTAEVAKVEEPKEEKKKKSKWITKKTTTKDKAIKSKTNKVSEQEKAKIVTNTRDNDAPILIVDENITVNNSSYSFVVKAEDKGSEKIFIQVDGVTSEFKDGIFKIERFSPVDEKIILVAIDQWGNKSNAKTVNIIVDIKDTIVAKKIEKLKPSKLKVKKSRNKVALIIGIENYAQSPNATFANLDAKYFYEYASRGFGVKKENIKLLIDNDATLIKSIGVLSKWLPSRVKPEETDLIIFFAGHGLASNDGKDLFLLSQDSDPDLLARTALSRTELFKEIIKLNPKSVTMFLDTCYSGVSRDDKTLLASARPVRIIADEQDTPNNFTIFSASQLDQISSGFKEAKHGIFSYYLMKGLEGNADANKDRSITNGELLAYMDQNVAQKASELGRQQNPSLSGNKDKILLKY